MMESNIYEVSELFRAAAVVAMVSLLGISAWSLYRLMQLKNKEGK